MVEMQKMDGELPVVLSRRLLAARRSLMQKIAGLDINALEISDYNKRYLGNIIANLERFLELQGRLIERSLRGTQKPLSQIVLVDVGAGTGMYSFLALEAGVGTVVANDIYDVSCRDVKVIGEALGLPLEHVVEGDAVQLVGYLLEQKFEVDALTSYDVIEHIYNVPEHFRIMRRLVDEGPSKHLRIVYASTANIANPKRVKVIQETQRMVERETRESTWGHKERDTLTSYYEVRKQLITAHAPALEVAEVEFLARDTRGLAQPDIEAAVDEFKATGAISHKMRHPTNTCDPFTGNWCEHLLDFSELIQICREAGFQAVVKPGMVNTCGAPHKRFAKRMINVGFQGLGRAATRWAPYYVLVADAG